MLIEVDEEHLVFRVAGGREGQRCRDHLGSLGTHAAAVVDDKTHSHGNVFVTEMPDRLRNAVLKNLKRTFGQSGNRSTATVKHRSVQYYLSNVHTKGVTRVG